MSDIESPAIPSYDPHILVSDVIGLLRERGLNPDTSPGHLGPALAGAGMLLRALGILPAIDAVEALRRSSERVWGESQDEP